MAGKEPGQQTGHNCSRLFTSLLAGDRFQVVLAIIECTGCVDWVILSDAYVAAVACAVLEGNGQCNSHN